MKRITLFFVLSVICLFSGCEMHHSDNGLLDGFWQMTAVDTIGGQSADMRQSRVFWCIQGDVLQMRRMNGVLYEEKQGIVAFRFEQSDNTLTVSEPVVCDRANSDSLLTDISIVTPYGVNSLKESFQVLRLDGSAMTLESAELRLHFRRY
jgi:hypothetical protein